VKAKEVFFLYFTRNRVLSWILVSFSARAVTENTCISNRMLLRVLLFPFQKKTRENSSITSVILPKGRASNRTRYLCDSLGLHSSVSMVCPLGEHCHWPFAAGVPSVKFLTVALAETFQLPRREAGTVRLTTFFLYTATFLSAR